MPTVFSMIISSRSRHGRVGLHSRWHSRQWDSTGANDYVSCEGIQPRHNAGAAGRSLPQTPIAIGPYVFVGLSLYHFLSQEGAPSLGNPSPSAFRHGVDHRRISAVAAVGRPCSWRQNKDCLNAFQLPPGPRWSLPPPPNRTAISFPIAPTAAQAWLLIK